MAAKRWILWASALAAAALVCGAVFLPTAQSGRRKWNAERLDTPTVVNAADADASTAAGRGNSAPATTCSIAVLVVESESQRPLPGAALRVYRDTGATGPVAIAEGRTDAGGRSAWHRLVGRSFLVAAEYPGRVRAVTKAYALFPSKEGEVDLGTVTVSLARGVPLECEVRQEESELPVAGVPVVALQGGWIVGKGGVLADHSVPLAFEATDAGGRARLEGMPPGGVVTLVAKADGWTEASLVVQVPTQRASSDAGPTAVLSIARASCVLGRVLRRDGSPARGATVFAVQGPYWAMLADPSAAYDDPETWDVEEIQALRATTDATGAYGIRRLRPGASYRLLVLDGTHLASRVSSIIRAAPGGREIGRDLVLDTLRDLRVTLHGPDGPLPADPSTAELRPLDDSKPPGPAYSEDDVVLVFPGVHTGEYDLEISGGTVPHQSIPLLVGADGPAEIAIRVDAGCRIEGTVVDERGLPSPSAKVLAVPTSTGEPDVRARTTTSGESGGFVLAGLVPGTYMVSAQGGGVVSEPIEVRAPVTGARLLACRTGVLRFHLSDESGSTDEEPSVLLYGVAATDGRVGPSSFVKPAKNSNGAWTVLDVRPGHHVLVIWVASCAPSEVVVDLSPGQDLSLGEIRLEVGVVLHGAVIDPEGKPVAGAIVGTRWKPEAARTDADGRFSVKNLPRGRVNVVVEAPGFLRDGVEVTIADGREAVIHVSRGGQINGRVVGEADGAESLVVRGRDPDDKVGCRRFEVRPDAEGRFKARIHPGTIHIQVFSGELLKASATAVVQEGGAVDVVLSIE
jgi:protocatechuate 3,4-dioxygenase beta subunit